MSSDTSFCSLFQKSTEPARTEESKLIQTMYIFLRCGIMDNPSEDTKANWLSAFDCYGILWRQRFLNGASSDDSFQQIFRDFCRTFHPVAIPYHVFGVEKATVKHVLEDDTSWLFLSYSLIM